MDQMVPEPVKHSRAGKGKQRRSQTPAFWESLRMAAAEKVFAKGSLGWLK